MNYFISFAIASNLNFIFLSRFAIAPCENPSVSAIALCVLPLSLKSTMSRSVSSSREARKRCVSSTNACRHPSVYRHSRRAIHRRDQVHQRRASCRAWCGCDPICVQGLLPVSGRNEVVLASIYDFYGGAKSNHGISPSSGHRLSEMPSSDYDHQWAGGCIAE